MMDIKRGVRVPIGAFVPHPKNYNRHSDTQLRDLQISLQKFGQVAAVVVQAGPQPAYDVGPDQYLSVAGHGLVQAAGLLGWSEVVADVLPADQSDEYIVAYMAADNELARASDPDLMQLAQIADDLRASDEELARLAAGGDEQLSALLDMLVEPEDLLGEAVDLAADLQRKWQTATGQLWEIPSNEGGAHRLLIGDSTDALDVATLFDGQKCDSLVTDPPYGVDYQSKDDDMRSALRMRSSRSRNVIENDAREDYREFFADFLRAIPFASRNTIFIFMSSRELHNLRLAFDDARIYFSQFLTWIKSRRVLGRTDWQWQTEFIAMGGAFLAAQGRDAAVGGVAGGRPGGGRAAVAFRIAAGWLSGRRDRRLQVHRLWLAGSA